MSRPTEFAPRPAPTPESLLVRYLRAARNAKRPVVVGAQQRGPVSVARLVAHLRTKAAETHEADDGRFVFFFEGRALAIVVEPEARA